MSEDPARGDAGGAVVEGETESKSPDEPGQVRVGADEYGIGAGEFEGAGSQAVGGCGEDGAAGFGGPRQEDTVGEAWDGSDGRFRIGGQDDDEIGIETRLDEEADESARGGVPRGGWLEEDGVAGGEGLKDLGAGDEERVIGRGNDEDHAEGFAEDAAEHPQSQMGRPERPRRFSRRASGACCSRKRTWSARGMI